MLVVQESATVSCSIANLAEHGIPHCSRNWHSVWQLRRHFVLVVPDIRDQLLPGLPVQLGFRIRHVVVRLVLADILHYLYMILMLLDPYAHLHALIMLEEEGKDKAIQIVRGMYDAKMSLGL